MKIQTLAAIVIFSALNMVSVNAIATDSSGAAQLETTPPAPEGALTADQIPPITQKSAANNNNNPQGGGQPATTPMTPTGGNATSTPAAPTSLPMNAAPASPATGNATQQPANVNPALPRQ